MVLDTVEESKVKDGDSEIVPSVVETLAAVEASSKGSIHHVIRTISKKNDNLGGAYPVHEINNYINDFLEAGWKLDSAHYLGREEDFGYTMLWIFVREWK